MWTARALAEALLGRVPDFPERAEIERLAGVAEFNCGLDFQENETPAITHFKAALGGERDPFHRAALLDRLALYAARDGDTEDALAKANGALEESLRVDHPYQPLVEAWVRSGHAFTLFCARRRQAAEKECLAADALMSVDVRSASHPSRRRSSRGRRSRRARAGRRRRGPRLARRPDSHAPGATRRERLLAAAARRIKKARFRAADRGLLVALAATFSQWREALILVKPETLLRWHRQGFKLLWTWRSKRKSKSGPRLSKVNVDYRR
jgi:hypothetical protein